jgi:hypothetical protein
MHAHGTTSLNLSSPIGVQPQPDECTSQTLNRISTKSPIQLLSVGRIEPTLISNALRDEPDFMVSVVKDYRELWLQSREDSIEIALLHNSLCSFELEQSARLVRSRWPKAQILIIRSDKLHIDRDIYDECLLPSVNSEVLVQRIFNLAQSLNEGRHPCGDC